MADVTWPYNLAQVLIDGAEIGFADNTKRSAFESGLVEQKRFEPDPMFLRTVTIRVLHNDYPEFRRWLLENAHKWFNFQDAFQGDELMRSVRIQGGAGAVQLTRANDFAKGNLTGPGGETLTTPQAARYWTGQITVEGFI